MGAEAAIIGGGLVSFLFIYTMSKLEERHFLLKLFLLFFSAIAVLLIGQATQADSFNCSWLPDNSTVSGSTTNYDYSYHCNETPTGANAGIYLLTTWYFRILATYSIIYFLYMAFIWIKSLIVMKKKGKFSIKGR